MKPQLRIRKVIYLLGALLVAGLGMTAMLLAMPAAASEQVLPATVWLDGPKEEISVGDEITVTVRISDVAGLYGIDLSLIFTPTDLAVVDADAGTPGVQISAAECPHPDFEVRNVVSNTVGTVEYVVTQLNPTPPFSGDCSVAHIRVKAMKAASTVVSFDELILSDNAFGQIPATTVDLGIEIAKEDPTLVTTPNPDSGTVGDTLNDTTTLSGGYNPTGTIVFKLYDPTDATCSGDPAWMYTVDPVNGNADYSTAVGHTADLVGVWRWTAEYSGDDNNNPASSGCQDEQVTIVSGKKYLYLPLITE